MAQRTIYIYIYIMGTDTSISYYLSLIQLAPSYTYIICANVSDNLREWNDVKGNLAAFHFYSFSLNTPFISCMGLLSKKHLQTWLAHAFSWMCIRTWIASVDSYYILFACYSLHIIMQTVIRRARNGRSCKRHLK